jgi:dCTP deaminase
LSENQKEEIIKFFDKEWIKEVAGKEGKDPEEIVKDIKDKFEGITYDLRLGEEAFTSTSGRPIDLREKGSVEIEPGETALLMTYEKVNVPEDHMAFLSLKTTHAAKGLINISGFHIDPNWKGKLVFSLYNSGPRPVVLRYKERIYHMFPVRLSDRAWGPEEKSGISDEARKKSMSFYDMKEIPSSWIEAIKGPPISLVALDKELRVMKERQRILIALLIAFLGSIIGVFITLVTKIV